MQTLKNENGEVFYRVEYNPEMQAVHSAWFGDFLSLEQVQEASSLGLKLLKEHKAAFLLNDNQKLEAPWEHANAWIAENWMPQALAVGLKCFAHVVSPNIFAKFSAEFMKDNTQNDDTQAKVEGFELKLFESVEDANLWLKERRMAMA
jgi:hypothetical protein